MADRKSFSGLVAAIIAGAFLLSIIGGFISNWLWDAYKMSLIQKAISVESTRVEPAGSSVPQHRSPETEVKPAGNSVPQHKSPETEIKIESVNRRGKIKRFEEYKLKCDVSIEVSLHSKYKVVPKGTVIRVMMIKGIDNKHWVCYIETPLGIEAVACDELAKCI